MNPVTYHISVTSSTERIQSSASFFNFFDSVVSFTCLRLDRLGVVVKLANLKRLLVGSRFKSIDDAVKQCDGI